MLKIWKEVVKTALEEFEAVKRSNLGSTNNFNYSKDELELWMDTLDGSRLKLGVNLVKGIPTTFHKQKTAKAPSPA